MHRERVCSDCETEASGLSRRRFVQTIGAVAASSVALPNVIRADEAADAKKPETLVKKLFDSLTPTQREEVCFAWNHEDDRGLLRTHVSNNWHITDVKKLNVVSDFFTKDQQGMIEAIFYGLYNPAWHDRLKQQLKDDAGGYGKAQSIALFGTPGSEKFEFVMTGRHLTIRCDGNSTESYAFGGPIFYGHAAKGFNEEANHPGNVYWHQALKANALYQMLDGKQREKALLEKTPGESQVGFKGNKLKPGLACSDLSAGQKKHVQEVLSLLLEPYRSTDQQEAMSCFNKQGGWESCNIAFYKSDDIGNDGVWDNWRLEGPSFVWYFRGAPHVHVWVNVADNADQKLNAQG